MISNYLLPILLPGPFTPRPSRAKGVDFTAPIGIVGSYTIIVPLRFQDNFWSITDPFSPIVWICFLISIPTYVGAIISMDYFFNRSTSWKNAINFVIRVIFSESTDNLPPKHLYQKLIVQVWSWMTFVLLLGYLCNLRALLTKPIMKIPFTDSEGMVQQTEMKWGFMQNGIFFDYAQSKDAGPTLRKIYDQSMADKTAFNKSFSCQYIVDEGYAAICDISVAKKVITKGFSKDGTCNYYLTDDRMLASDNVLAIQASKVLNQSRTEKQLKVTSFRNKVHTWKTSTDSFSWPYRWVSLKRHITITCQMPLPAIP